MTVFPLGGPWYRLFASHVKQISAPLLGLLLTLSLVDGQDTATVGDWSPVMTWPYEAIHAQVLPTGKVMFWTRGDHSQLWDPATNTVSSSAVSGANIFCSGHAFLPDGRLLMAGGHVSSWVGLPNAYIYSPFNGTWTRLPDMNNGRWYPTNTSLPNGDVLVVSGWINTTVGVNVEPQVWQTAAASWRDLTSAHLALPFYPFMFVAPNGKVFCAGPSQATRYLNVSGTGTWNLVANNNFGRRNWSSAVMYDDGKVLLTGGSPCAPYSTTCTELPTATAETIDLNSSTPAWNYTGSMVTGGRKLHNATLLADGKVLVTGGSRGGEDPNTQPRNPANESELWDPTTGTWTQMASITVCRAYHAIALLLPDARVLSAGGDFGGASAEIYSPPYLFNGARPTITSAPTNVTYGQSFFVGTPDPASIANVTLIALSSVTHGFNMGQRISRPAFSQASGGLNVTAPSNANTTPPGYYMLFILNSNGVPSVANILQINATLTPAPTPTWTIPITVQTNPAGLTFAVDGTTYSATQTFSWTPGSSHTIATTSPQSAGTGVRYLWNKWSDGKAISHIVAPTTNNTYTVMFNTQYYLTMSPGTGGTVSPSSGWRASGAAVSISATPATGYNFSGWTGSGTGSYIGINNPASITMSGPITEAATFAQNTTPTPTPTDTPTPTPTPSPTPTPTPTDTPTPTPTPSPTPTPTPTSKPAAPAGLKAVIASASSVNLSWQDKSTNEAGFNVERSTDGHTFTIVATVGNNVTAYSDTGLVTPTTYSYRVSAFNSAGTSGYSNTVSVALTIPTAPTSLTATVSKNGQITLKWADKSNNETGFQVERSNDGSVFAVIATTATNATNYKDTTAVAGQTYYYRVAAKNNVGLSSYSNVVTVP